MLLNRYKLGELLELVEERNSNLEYGIEDVKGISITKTFIETKADMNDVPLEPYCVVKPDDFVYVTVTSRNAEKITLAHNDSEDTFIVSSSYVVFRISRPDILLSDYLFMYFNRPEFDRYARFFSWGSARETFDFEQMCDIEIALPPVAVQEKYVAIYLAQKKNLLHLEKTLQDLKTVCDLSIERLKGKYKMQEIGEYCSIRDERNSDLSCTNIKGLTVVTKEFITTKADMTGVSLENYKLVKIGDIVFVPTTNRNGDRLACALATEECIVFSIYEVLKINNSKCYSEYLFMWFKRQELDRWSRYNSWGSARETITTDDLLEYKIPIPPLEVQRSIADIYRVYTKRKALCKKMRQQARDLCPILVRGSLEEKD